MEAVPSHIDIFPVPPPQQPGSSRGRPREAALTPASRSHTELIGKAVIMKAVLQSLQVTTPLTTAILLVIAAIMKAVRGNTVV